MNFPHAVVEDPMDTTRCGRRASLQQFGVPQLRGNREHGYNWEEQ
jgi:hypothetical protein